MKKNLEDTLYVKRIPIKKAKEIWKEYGLDYTIVVGVKEGEENNNCAIATYGRTKQLCSKAGSYSPEIARLILETYQNDMRCKDWIGRKEDGLNPSNKTCMNCKLREDCFNF